VFVPTVPNTLSFEWVTTPVRMKVVDQTGASLRGSVVKFLGSAPPGYGAGSAFGSGTTLYLPIADFDVYPTLSGAYADGYDFTVLATSSLERDVLDRAVTASTSAIDIEWITSDVTLRVVDQDGTALDGTSVRLRYSGVGGLRAGVSPRTGTTLALPVTDAALYPGMRGFYSDGYDFTVVPTSSGGLQRHVDNRVTTPATRAIAFEWLVAECELSLFDAVGLEVLGSTLQFPAPIGTIATGDLVRLPITDNTVYPTLFGSHADGYPVTVEPADIAPASETFRFEVAANGQLTPESFRVGANEYSLRCTSNEAPVADAGPNVTVMSSSVVGMVVNGTASDPDGDALAYRWLEGTFEVTPRAPVGPGGAAPLELSAAQIVAVGSHTLTLEVTDGELIATDTVVVTIGNAPPDVVCSGGGTYGVSGDVTLAGSVSDHDGDLLSYDWSTGGVVLVSGLVQSNVGGAPVAIRPAVISAGDLALGLNIITLTVEDPHGASTQCTAEIRLVDAQGPTLAPTVSVSILWPTNHRLVQVVIDANAADAGGGPVTLSAVVQCSSNAGRDKRGRRRPDFTTPVIDQERGRRATRSQRCGASREARWRTWARAGAGARARFRPGTSKAAQAAATLNGERAKPAGPGIREGVQRREQGCAWAALLEALAGSCEELCASQLPAQQSLRSNRTPRPSIRCSPSMPTPK